MVEEVLKMLYRHQHEVFQLNGYPLVYCRQVYVSTVEEGLLDGVKLLKQLDIVLVFAVLLNGMVPIDHTLRKDVVDDGRSQTGFFLLDQQTVHVEEFLELSLIVYHGTIHVCKKLRKRYLFNQV